MTMDPADQTSGQAVPETAYVLGTSDDEVARLALQHRAWLPHVSAAWRRAGFRAGHTVLDIGCGPGYAAIDLSEVVGVTGRVVAADKSRRFLDVLEAMRSQRGIDNISSHQIDFDSGELPAVAADGAWLRWVLAFVLRPRELLERVGAAVRPGGSLVIHEYFDYSTWRTAPRCPEVEEFVIAVMSSWRDAGGEPDIGLALPRWLDEMGFDVVARPIVELVPPAHLMWLWLRTFIETHRGRLADRGYLTAARAEGIWEAFLAAESAPGIRMVTPGLLEVVAVKR